MKIGMLGGMFGKPDIFLFDCMHDALKFCTRNNIPCNLLERLKHDSEKVQLSINKALVVVSPQSTLYNHIVLEWKE